MPNKKCLNLFQVKFPALWNQHLTEEVSFNYFRYDLAAPRSYKSGGQGPTKGHNIRSTVLEKIYENKRNIQKHQLYEVSFILSTSSIVFLWNNVVFSLLEGTEFDHLWLFRVNCFFGGTVMNLSTSEKQQRASSSFVLFLRSVTGQLAWNHWCNICFVFSKCVLFDI